MTETVLAPREILLSTNRNRYLYCQEAEVGRRKKKVQVFANRITSNKTSAGKKYLESALTKP